MSAVLRITRIDVRPLRRDISTLGISLENVGVEPLSSGALLVHERLTNGSAHPCELYIKSLSPGEKIELFHPIQGPIKGIDLKGFRSLNGTVTPSLLGLLSWWQSPWSLKVA
jgi:hypothetical protein